MAALALVSLAGFALLAAYFTYGRWLSRRIFKLDDARPTPAHTERDDEDYIPSRRSVVFGHHFASIAGTGPIVGPAIAVMWGWLPALLWVVLGSIFVGAVHDLGSLVVSLRSRGRSIGDLAGDLLGPRVRLIFLAILIVGLWIVLAIFGLVIASVLRQYPAAITPILIQTPIAVAIGLLAHRSGRSILVPSIVALALMYASVVYGDTGPLHAFNAFLAQQPVWIWTAALLAYCYVASVLPVWVLLQPRDYINALQLVTSLALITAGLIAAGLLGGAPQPVRHDAAAPVLAAAQEVAAAASSASPSLQPALRPPLHLVAPMIDWQPAGAPPLLPLLFITVACGACSGFHCLVSSGTTSKQVDRESDAHAVGYGAMLTEGFLATLVIIACAAGLGLGVSRDLEATSRPRLRYNTSAYEFDLKTTTIQAPDQPPMIVLAETIAEGPVGQPLQMPDRPRAVRIFDATQGKPTTMVWADGDGRVGAALRIIGNDPVQAMQSREADALYEPIDLGAGEVRLEPSNDRIRITGPAAFATQYRSWDSAGALSATVAAFVEGAANFIAALGIPATIGIPLVAVMVAAFAATTLDTACRLQRYVIQEFAQTFLPKINRPSCRVCAYDLSAHLAPAVATESPVTITCPECGTSQPAADIPQHRPRARYAAASWFNPFKWLATTHGATLLAVVSAFVLAMGPWPTAPVAQPPALLGGIPLVGQSFSQQSPGFLDQFVTWIQQGGKGGLILWPLFGATNQLLAGFAFVVIAAWLIARRKPIWFLVLPGIFMLAVPAAAMIWQAYIGNEANPAWIDQRRWTLAAVATITLALEAWLLVEVALRWRRGGRAASFPLTSPNP